MIKSFGLAVAATISLAVAQPASASLVYLGDDIAPGGVGNSQIVLSLQSPKKATSETGSVSASSTGPVCDGNTQSPCKSPSNQTPSFASAHVTSAAAVRIYLDAAEPDNSITATKLLLTVYDATTFKSVFTAQLDTTPLTLTTYSGQGANPVNIFALDQTEASALQAVFDSSELVGLSAGFTSATGGPDRLFLASAATDVVPAPEPASVALLGAGLLGAGVARRRRG